MDVVSNLRHFWTLLEVLGVVKGIVADVLGCSAAEERMLQAGAICCMEIDELLVDALFAEEVERQT